MKRFKNILALYDDSIGPDDALAQACALATSVASAKKAKLHILHARQSGKKQKPAGSGPMDQSLTDGSSEEVLRRESLEDLLSGYDMSAIEHEVSLPESLPAQVVSPAARTHDADELEYEDDEDELDQSTRAAA